MENAESPDVCEATEDYLESSSTANRGAVVLFEIRTGWERYRAVSEKTLGKTLGGGQIVLAQIRTVDKGRLVKRLGKLEMKTGAKALNVLQEMFAL